MQRCSTLPNDVDILNFAYIIICFEKTVGKSVINIENYRYFSRHRYDIDRKSRYLKRLCRYDTDNIVIGDISPVFRYIDPALTWIS